MRTVVNAQIESLIIKKQEKYLRQGNIEGELLEKREILKTRKVS